MSALSSLFLGFIQGLTEFLPISSSGHLNLVQYFLNLTPSLTFDVFLNTATLLSVLVFFRGQIKYFLSNLKYILVATLPAAFIGVLLKDQISTIFSSIHFLPLFFLITSVFLFSTRTAKNKSVLNYKSALIIGLVQALALLPGVSRSGTTIATALLLGISPIDAFNFSFCLFIPTSLGALLLDSKAISSLSFTPVLILSFIISFLVGLFALFLLKKALTRKSFWYFGIYTFSVSILLFFLFFLR
ncbi:UDP-diphosphatase [Candidatus Shapirobacteria bacterium CG06_land_8_20_14_3_00_40_12]|uniref:Undecaprenyl-diphosphatase n=2 Tax=Candidatus Shapironibacteriota TaxID=1752721 RepID=A0A2M7TSX7_9BACT|nr:MAG: UDP-diphosphatase [Candidatus Shapirobacteria bacterium CG06_land_8_20_14_3_00_40_12]PIZ58910.1 MAG: UDP-diphosphatase [Candidatus Shapirobacteria bacterium CG_4_10_14_0_2_um_filter_40_12]